MTVSSAPSACLSPEAPAAPSSPSRFLRNVLRLDALSCLACGAVQVAITAPLSRWLGFQEGLVGGTGEFLLAYGAAVGVLSALRAVPRTLAWLLVAGNLGWAVACAALLVSHYPAASAASASGVAYVLLQAVVVAVLAGLQILALRRPVARPAW